jgi:pSer/pThr/pTyr-binding forkhead associated (FHA) protein
MNFQQVTLTVTRGLLDVREYLLGEPACCMIGRAQDCDIQLPPCLGHVDVSRHHCVVEVTPDAVRVRDLGSRNGTFVNGAKIGQRFPHQPAEEADLRECPPVELKNGDELQVGATIFRIGIGTLSESGEGPAVPMYFV